MFTNVIGFIMNRVSTKSRDLTPGFGNKKHSSQCEMRKLTIKYVTISRRHDRPYDSLNVSDGHVTD